MSLKGEKLLNHLRRESQMASKHTIATDLSVWNIDDGEQFQDMMDLM